MATKKTKATVAPKLAWEILWRNYIAALKKPQTGANLDKVERLKKQIDSFDQRWLGLDPEPRVAASAKVRHAAERIVEKAGRAGGEKELRKLATFGWPHDQPLENDSFELRNAIQDEAKRLEARL